MSENNGKWQLAFWIISVVAGVWLLGLSSNMVLNDRVRASEDIRIESHIALVNADFSCKYAEIITRLTRIEARMEK